MLGSPYLSSPAACSRAGARNHRKHLLLPSKAQKSIQHNEILKASNFPGIIASLCLEKQLYQVMEECKNRRNLEGALAGNRWKAAHHFLHRLMT